MCKVFKQRNGHKTEKIKKIKKVVQDTYDGESVMGIRYLYKNIKNEDGRIIYDEFKSDNETVKDIKVIKIAKELIEKYIFETQNSHDKTII